MALRMLSPKKEYLNLLQFASCSSSLSPELNLKSDRTSCHRFEANQFRVFLHSAAYVLIHALKTNVLRHTQFANATIDTIRLRILKIGARVRELKTKIKIELSSSYPLKSILTKGFHIFELLSRI